MTSPPTASRRAHAIEGTFRAVVSGERRGALAAALRLLLALAAAFYALAVLARALLFRVGILRQTRVGAPVVSVGNIVAGGTGKTPMVEHIARRLLARGRRPAILSRGYGAQADGDTRNDEALVLAANLPTVPQVIDPVRVRGAATALAAGADTLVLDDGFQHRHIARDLDLVLVDALEPFGFRRLLPRGLLREPLAALARAHAFAITRADLCPPERLEAIRAELAALRPGAPILEVVEEAVGLDTLPDHPERSAREARAESKGGLVAIATLAGRRIYAFCGIGNPAGFFRRLEALGAVVVARRAFPDHHGYAADDVRALAEAARKDGLPLVTTQKDAVKLARFPEAHGVRVLLIRVRIRRGEEELERLLDAALGGSCPGGGNPLPTLPAEGSS